MVDQYFNYALLSLYFISLKKPLCNCRQTTTVVLGAISVNKFISRVTELWMPTAKITRNYIIFEFVTAYIYYPFWLMKFWSPEYFVTSLSRHSPNQGVGPILLTRCFWIDMCIGLFQLIYLSLWMIVSVLLWVCVVVTLVVVIVITVVTLICCYSYRLLLHIVKFIVECSILGRETVACIYFSWQPRNTHRVVGWQIMWNRVNFMIHIWKPTQWLVRNRL